jgi:hypothetical protein
VPAIEEWIGADEQRLSALLSGADEFPLEFSLDCGTKNEQRQSSPLQHILRVLTVDSVPWVHQQGYFGGFGHQLSQQLQTLRR